MLCRTAPAGTVEAQTAELGADAHKPTTSACARGPTSARPTRSQGEYPAGGASVQFDRKPFSGH